MPSLISGQTLRRGGSGEFIDLAGAQPQLPPTPTTATGFTLVTDELLRTSYRSSLGFIEFNTASMWSSLPEGAIRILATGSTFLSTTTQTGNLVVEGGIGVGGNMIIEDDIVVNGITIGRGWEGLNNIVVRGTADPLLTNFLNGQESIAVGFDTLLGLSTAYKVIAIGRNAISSGTKVSESIAIGDSALKDSGVTDYVLLGSITSATQTSPVVVTIPSHNVSTGTYVKIMNVSGMIELNDNQYWVNRLNDSELALYIDNIISSPLNGTGFTAYSSGGIAGRVLARNNNIAIGNNAAEKLVDGQKNFFFGDLIAKNMTTGSNNLFIGSDVAGNITRANGIISIGSDNLVNDRDNQVAIGSVFYYNGTGTATINANTEIGIGTQSTSTNTGGLTVIGGAGVQRNLYVGEELHAEGVAYFSSSLLPIGDVDIGSSSTPFRSLFLQGSTLYLSTVTLKSYNELNFSVESPAGFVRQTIGNLTLNSGVESTGYTNGSLVVTGGVGITGDINLNGGLNVLGPEDSNLSPAGADVYIQPTLGGTILIEPSATGNLDNMIIGANNSADGTFDSLSANNITATALTQSTSTTTGALQVSGGAGIKGNVYAASGNADENYLLYTPRSTVSTTAPIGARVGDFWINPAGPYFLQYVLDGENRIWVQI